MVYYYFTEYTVSKDILISVCNMYVALETCKQSHIVIFVSELMYVNTIYIYM